MTKKSPLEKARETLRDAVPEAAEVLVKSLRDQDGKVSYRAALEILNRAGITAAGSVSVSVAEREIGGRGPSKNEEFMESLEAESFF
jgi:hypothetical protein